MTDNSQPESESFHSRLSHNKRTQTGRKLLRAEIVLVLLGVTAVLIHIGAAGKSASRIPEVSHVILVAMVLLTTSRVYRSCCCLQGTLANRIRQAGLILPLLWMGGIIVLSIVRQGAVLSLDVFWTESVLALIAIVSLLRGCRLLASRTHNSAVLLAGSFLVVITVGTALLMLPVCRPLQDDGTRVSADWHVALFTATSASCVTGLIVEPTGSYWSPVGHGVIFGLFQIGGLGILTFGAFLAVLSGRKGLQFREAKTLRDMLDAESVQDSRRLLLTILMFTICVEGLGAVCLMGLWPDLPLSQRIWPAVFHSVSAFCNAGFSLTDEGFLGMGARWQVWGPLTWLIILGGLGFPVIHDLWCAGVCKLRNRRAHWLYRESASPVRLSLNSRLVLWSTVVLLLAGAIFWFVLESLSAAPDASTTQQIADSWFQSVTFRTAGFNTVDHGTMHPATKLLAVFLMFIGAAPGSTGGGVKTVVFAITILNLHAVFRGRDRVEVFGRCIPPAQVARALSMIAIGLFIVLGTTGLLVIFEDQPERFLDHLYEATSAFATVGVSTGITGDLTLPSRILICVVMFLGRVGPITLLLAMAVPSERSRYEYPVERVNLG